MHLFEAFLILHAITGVDVYLDYARSVFELFKAHFYNASTGDIIEFFDADWTRAENNGGPIEPGHMMEWCWLLRNFEAQSGVDVSLYADTLFTHALDIGLNTELGFLCDTVENGQQSSTLRSWPQTEYLKACIAQARTGRIGMEAQAARLIERMFDTYLNTDVQGGWHDLLSAKGDVISSVMPTSTFYHWFCAVAEVSDFAQEHYG